MDPRESPFAFAEELITSLLLYWMHPSQPASLLLCGPSGNGKSHVTRTAVARAKAIGRRAVFSISPPLAASLAVRHADGSTALRRDIRRAIARGAAELRADDERDIAVSVVLDHTELLLCTTTRTGTSTSDAAAPQQPVLLGDLYDCIRSRPLFDAAELHSMRLSCVLFVVLFSGPYDDVEPLARATLFDAHIALRTPTEAERTLFFSSGRAPFPRALAARSGGVTYRGLAEILANAAFIAGAHSAREGPSEESAVSVSVSVALRAVRAFAASGSAAAVAHRASAGYVDVQETRWGDIAGLDAVKRTLRELVRRPFRAGPTYRRFGVRPSTGVLLHGPPGTGKTTLARAMATELDASFVYIDIPGLVHAEVGESERRLREFFDVARERSPSVMFIDELQAAFATQDSADNSAHDARLVAQLLHLLDDAQEDTEHFMLFVGATNVIHLIDPALLRAGRLDTIIEVPLPDEPARRALVSRIVNAEWASWLGPSVDVRQILIDLFIHISEGLSGAEVQNIMHIFAIQFLRISEKNIQCLNTISAHIFEARTGALSASAQKAIQYAINIAAQNHTPTTLCT